MPAARGTQASNGVLAAVAGYGVAFVVGLATNTPFVANGIADRVMEATPLGIATRLLAAFGPAAKPLALAGALALTAVLAAASGAVLGWGTGKSEAIESARVETELPGTSPDWRVGALTQPLPPRWERRWWVLALAAAQAGIVVLLAGPRSWHGVVLPYSVWTFVMVAMGQEPVPSAGRRWFLRRGAQAAGGLVLLSTAATWTLLAKSLTGARPGRPLFAFEPPAPRQPAFAGVEGLSPEVTPITSFYLMSKTVEDPAVDAGSWRLRVRGLVQRELELTYDDLARLPRTDQWLTLRCVSNPVGGPLIGNALWSGVTLPALLSLAGVQPATTTLVMAARDGYSDGVPLERAQRDGTLLAYGVNGGLLNRDHGFPARVLVPGLYGFKNVKWVEELRLIAGDFEGPWQRLGWTRTAIQTTFSRIDFVRRTTTGALAGGIAYAGDRGIRSVEVRAGDQPWRAATLHTPPLGSLSWVQWLFPFQASGRTAVTVRATDGDGTLQEESERGIFPDGATGWHTVTADL